MTDLPAAFPADFPITAKWPPLHPERLQLYSATNAERGEGVDHARRDRSALRSA